jgi:hypothetical protein
MYKPAAPVAPKVRKPRNGLVRNVRNGGLIRVEQKSAAKIIELPIKKDVMTAALTKNSGFSLMR